MPPKIVRKRIKVPRKPTVYSKHPVFLWSQAKTAVCYRLNPLAEKTKHIPLPGVIKTLARLFYPRYKYENAVHVTQGKKSRQEAEFDKEKKTTNSYGKKDTQVWGATPYQRQKRGMKKGIRVEAQFDTCLYWYQRLGCGAVMFFQPLVQSAVARTLTDTNNDKKDFNSICKNLESYCEKLWGMMWQYHLIPIETQVVVGCLLLKRGTKLDIKCKHALNNKKVGFELKINCTYKNECTGKMSYPFHQQTDAPRNHHYLQSLLTWELYDRSWPNDKLSDYLVGWFDAIGCEVDRIPQDIITQKPLMLQAIMQDNLTNPKATTYTPKKKMSIKKK